MNAEIELMMLEDKVIVKSILIIEDENDDEDDDECDEEEGWNCCKCKCDFKESEVEHIEEVDDAVCYTCCIKYGYSVVSQQEEEMLA